ncbi:hypothetical protein PR048_028361 [Dryococelus australis]|uniref:Integrase catalytic domain-containing protein n=1 Tax=Dryococelus australis TaxID=614101 RepID=A0ABQ9GJ25_9NEOP|nr:hypothetical protein PR048_028361 [Dryococelus australis]
MHLCSGKGLLPRICRFGLLTGRQPLTWLFSHLRQLGNIANGVADASSNIYYPMEFQIAEDKDIANCQEFCQVLLLIPEYFFNIHQWQEEDAEGKVLEDKIQKGQSKDLKIMKVVNYHINRQGKKQFWVRQRVRLIILKYFHYVPVGVHMGQCKMGLKIWKDFSTVETKLQPWQRVYIDIFDPLVKSSIGNNCLLVFVDGFTRFCVLMLRKYMKAEAITRKQDLEIAKVYESLELFINENPLYFLGSVKKKLLFVWGVRKGQMRPY